MSSIQNNRTPKAQSIIQFWSIKAAEKYGDPRNNKESIGTLEVKKKV